MQWKLDLDHYNNLVTTWHEGIAAIDAVWRDQRDGARMEHHCPLKKPAPLTQPKWLLQFKGDPIVIQEAESNVRDMSSLVVDIRYAEDTAAIKVEATFDNY